VAELVFVFTVVILYQLCRSSSLDHLLVDMDLLYQLCCSSSLDHFLVDMDLLLYA